MDRFKDAIWLPVAQSHYITIGGAGGIGSCVAFLLSRIQPQKIIVYDNDFVSNINLSNQLFSRSHLGLHKVDAVNDVCQEFSNYNITAKKEKFTENSTTSEVMFSCFDNMEARKQMFLAFKKTFNIYKDLNITPILIDGRLTAEQFYIYVVTEDRMEDYEKTLFSDEEAAILPCGFKGTTHNSFMIASKMVACYTNFCANIATQTSDRFVPFCIENDIFTMTEIIS